MYPQMYLHSHFNTIFNTFQPYGIRLFYGRFLVVRRSFYERSMSVFTSESSTSGAFLYMPNKRSISSNPSTKRICYTRKKPRKKPVERILRPEWYRYNKGDQTRCYPPQIIPYRTKQTRRARRPCTHRIAFLMLS